MADFEIPQQEIENVVNLSDNAFVLVDYTTPTNRAIVTAAGELKVLVTGGGSAGQLVTDGQAAVGGDIGRIAVGYDGTNYQFISVDTTGKLQVVVSGTVAATQSGTWIVQPGNTANTTPWLFKLDQTGSNNDVDVISSVLPTGASTLAEQQTQTTSLQLIDDLPHLNLDTITGAKGVGMMGSDGSVLRWFKVDATGALAVQTQPSPNVFFIIGEITSATTTTKAVQKTTYTEQTSNAQRSIASASASDTSAGTGARTVKITYFNSTGAGPFTETVTLNGTTYVNTVATDICFIEKMEVVTVGSTGSNVGILTLKAATAGGGATIGTITALDNQTFWCHHYVATGKTMKVTGISVSHNGTTVGSGSVFFLRAKSIGVSNVPDIQISDFVRLYGQSSTFSRLYNSPVKVVGPARVLMFTTPETSTSIVYRAAVDFFEE